MANPAMAHRGGGAWPDWPPLDLPLDKLTHKKTEIRRQEKKTKKIDKENKYV